MLDITIGRTRSTAASGPTIRLKTNTLADSTAVARPASLAYSSSRPSACRLSKSSASSAPDWKVAAIPAMKLPMATSTNWL